MQLEHLLIHQEKWIREFAQIIVNKKINIELATYLSIEHFEYQYKEKKERCL